MKNNQGDFFWQRYLSLAPRYNITQKIYNIHVHVHACTHVHVYIHVCIILYYMNIAQKTGRKMRGGGEFVQTTNRQVRTLSRNKYYTCRYTDVHILFDTGDLHTLAKVSIYNIHVPIL